MIISLVFLKFNFKVALKKFENFKNLMYNIYRKLRKAFCPNKRQKKIIFKKRRLENYETHTDVTGST